MEHMKISLGVVLFLLLVVFTAQNAEVVTVNFFFWKLSVSRALMIFFVLAIGFVIGWSGAAFHFSKKHQQS